MALRPAYRMQRLCDHLKEAAYFSPKDLDSASHTLERMRDTLSRGKDTYSPHLLTLLENRLNTCQNLLGELHAILADLSPDLHPVYERLVSILRSISAANTRQKVLKIGFCHIVVEVTDKEDSSQSTRSRAFGINSRRSKVPWSKGNSLLKTVQPRLVKKSSLSC